MVVCMGAADSAHRPAWPCAKYKGNNKKLRGRLKIPVHAVVCIFPRASWHKAPASFSEDALRDLSHTTTRLSDTPTFFSRSCNGSRPKRLVTGNCLLRIICTTPGRDSFTNGVTSKCSRCTRRLSSCCWPLSPSTLSVKCERTSR